MTEQANIQNLDIKNLIEQNNEALREAIQALEILNNRILQQPDQVVPQPDKVVPQPDQAVPQYYQIPIQTPTNTYPGYTTPPRFGFMQQ